MAGLTPLSAMAPVPFRDRVAPVSAVARVELRLDGQDPAGAKAKPRERKAETTARHGAASAASAFSAHVLMQAGVAGQDPTAPAQAARAYARPPQAPVRLRATA
jgi:hypothetical protein